MATPLTNRWISGALVITLIATALGVAGCGSPDVNSGGSGRLKVTSTVSPITSIVENVGGGRIHLQGIVPEGTNSHTYEPPPSVARILAEADLIVLNGLFLEEPTLEMAKANKKPGAVILALGERTVSRDEWVFDFSFPAERSHPNPHLWTSPRMALRYAELVRDALSALDPDGAAGYAANYDAFAARIADLDARIREVIATIPPQNRKLLTYHDSFPYFGTDYGMEIIGAVQPSDFSDPSAREVAGLIEQVRATGVPAIFGSEVFPSPVMEQIAREGGATFIDQLRDDDLPGGPGDADHTYFGLIATNMRIMAAALGGNASAMDGFDTRLVFDGQSTARYPQ